MTDEPTERDVEAARQLLETHGRLPSGVCVCGVSGYPGHASHLVTLLAERIAEARREDADRDARILLLADEIENPRIQRPGMQRRRLWADRLRAALRGDA